MPEIKGLGKDFCPHSRSKRGRTKILVFKQLYHKGNFVVGENNREGRVDDFLPENACVVGVETLSSTPESGGSHSVTVYALYYHEVS